MEKVQLQAESRPESSRLGLREIRAAARVPAVVYGRDFETKTVSVNAKELHKAMLTAGAGLIELQLDGSPIQVLTREVQRDPIKRRALHVDFMAVSMTETLRIEVPIVMEGTSPALSRPEVVLVRDMDALEVECLPSAIPNHIVADISRLKSEADSLRVADLKLPEGVVAVTDGRRVVISLTVSRVGAEEEEAAATEGAAAAEPEVVTKGKKEEEEA